MRAVVLAFLLASCRGPDRWSTSVSRGHGDIDGLKTDFNTEETTLEVGISGPIGSPPDRRYPAMPDWTPITPPVSVEPAPGTDLATIVGGAVAIITAVLAAVKYIPSKHFEGPWDKKKE